MVTSTNQPTDRQGEYRAICLFRKLENRKKAEICKNQKAQTKWWIPDDNSGDADVDESDWKEGELNQQT